MAKYEHRQLFTRTPHVFHNRWLQLLTEHSSPCVKNWEHNVSKRQWTWCTALLFDFRQYITDRFYSLSPQVCNAEWCHEPLSLLTVIGQFQFPFLKIGLHCCCNMSRGQSSARYHTQTFFCWYLWIPFAQRLCPRYKIFSNLCCWQKLGETSRL